jgi:hypothetical protein
MMLQGYAEEAGAANPVVVGYQLQILKMGAVVAASSGDGQAARRPGQIAEMLLNGSS